MSYKKVIIHCPWRRVLSFSWLWMFIIPYIILVRLCTPRGDFFWSLPPLILPVFPTLYLIYCNRGAAYEFGGNYVCTRENIVYYNSICGIGEYQTWLQRLFKVKDVVISWENGIWTYTSSIVGIDENLNIRALIEDCKRAAQESTESEA